MMLHRQDLPDAASTIGDMGTISIDHALVLNPRGSGGSARTHRACR